MAVRLTAAVLLLSVALVPRGTLDAAGPGDDLSWAERTLEQNHVATDGPGLLAFFRSRTMSGGDRERLVLKVRQLGDDSYAVREKASADLVAAGQLSLPCLRAALQDPDLEVARRAERCLEEIETRPHTSLLTAAARLLQDRQPPGAVEVLLHYFPCAEEMSVEDAVLEALAALGLRGPKPDPALEACLKDSEPLCRAAAAHVLGRVARAEVRRPVARLLADPDVRVRFEAATALVEAGDREALPPLLALLSDAPVPQAYVVEDLLGRVAGDQAPEASLGPAAAEDRRKARAAWEAWWKAHGDRVDLARLQEGETNQGLTLVCEYDGPSGTGSVRDLGPGGKARWEVTGLQGPNDAQLLPGGRLLVAERNAGKVTERDRQGKILWQHFPANSPIACQRLANGHTLVTTFNELEEVDANGKKVRSHTNPGGFRHAVRTRNGHVLYVTSAGQIVELDADWKRVRSVTPAAHAQGASYWASIEPLPTGRFLLALGGANRVVEIDTTGAIQWECTLPSAVFATRLRNGNTLVSCFEGKCLVEVDRAGKEVRKQALDGRPFTVRRH